MAMDVEFASVSRRKGQLLAVLSPLFAVAAGGVAGELFSGTFHGATDHYGRPETPVVGFACAAGFAPVVTPERSSRLRFCQKI